MPPAVGSGCRQISVATGGLVSGRASSPTRFSPSPVRRVTFSRRAGSIVAAEISVISSSPVGLQSGPWPPRPALPACLMPVPALLRAWRLGRPDNDVRDTGRQFLVTAGTAVNLRRGRAGHLAHHPVSVG